MKRVVATNADGSVTVIVPSPRCVDVLMTGGAVVDRASAINLLLSSGSWQSDLTPVTRRRLAETWVEGLITGGLSEDEAVALIGEYSRAPGMTALEVIEAHDLPERTYRNSWRRSRNGGPVYIDEEHAAWGLYEQKNRAGAAVLRGEHRERLASCPVEHAS